MPHDPFNEFDPDHLQDAQKNGPKDDSLPGTVVAGESEVHTAPVTDDDVEHFPDPTDLLDPAVYTIAELDQLHLKCEMDKRVARSHLEELAEEHESILEQVADEGTAESTKCQFLVKADETDRRRAMYNENWQAADDVERLASAIKEFRQESPAHGQTSTQSAEGLSSRAERFREILSSQLRTATQVRAVMEQVTDEEGALPIGEEPTASTTGEPMNGHN